MAIPTSVARLVSAVINAEAPKKHEGYSLLSALADNNPDDIVLNAIVNELSSGSTFGAVTFTNEHAGAFATCFNASASIRNLRMFVAAQVIEAMQDRPCGDTCVIADVGVGDGVALACVLTALRQRGYHNTRLLLNDCVESMLDKAEQHLIEHADTIGMDITIERHCGSITDEGTLRWLHNACARIDCMTAQMSIHHFPNAAKRVLLRNLHAVRSRRLIIGDAESEHDLHDSRTLEIIANVMRLYNGVYASLVADGADDTVRTAALRFLGSEARDIVFGTTERVDYHTRFHNWRTLLTEAGFACVDPQHYFPHLSELPPPEQYAVYADHCDVFRFHGEPLAFSVSATPTA